MFPFTFLKFSEDLELLNIPDDNISKLNDADLKAYVGKLKRILLFNSFAVEQVFNILNSYEPLLRYFRRLEFDLRNYYKYLRESYEHKPFLTDNLENKYFDESDEDKIVSSNSKTNLMKTSETSSSKKNKKIKDGVMKSESHIPSASKAINPTNNQKVHTPVSLEKTDQILTTNGTHTSSSSSPFEKKSISQLQPNNSRTSTDSKESINKYPKPETSIPPKVKIPTSSDKSGGASTNLPELHQSTFLGSNDKPCDVEKGLTKDDLLFFKE